MNRSFVLKSRLRQGKSLIGSWLCLANPYIAEMMAGAGFDYLAVDMEHGHAGPAGMLQLIQTVELAGCSPLVRVAANDATLIKQAMDAGAHGVIVPDIRSPGDAERAVKAMYYPPRGTRGVGLNRAQGYGSDFERYRDERLGEAILVAQIEHRSAVEQIDDILAVDGVDAFIIGPYDLSGSIGLPGAFGDPRVVALLERAGEAIATSSKPGGYHIVQSDQAALKRRIEQGCRFMAYGTEMTFLGEKLAVEGAFVRTMNKE